MTCCSGYPPSQRRHQRAQRHSPNRRLGLLPSRLSRSVIPVSSPFAMSSTTFCTHKPKDSLPMLSQFCVPSTRSLDTEARHGRAAPSNNAAASALLRLWCCSWLVVLQLAVGSPAGGWALLLLLVSAAGRWTAQQVCLECRFAGQGLQKCRCNRSRSDCIPVTCCESCSDFPTAVGVDLEVFLIQYKQRKANTILR